MSKLIDELDRVGRNASRPMGFGIGGGATKSKKILLVASLSEEKAEALAEAASGADAGLILASGQESAIRALQKATAREKDNIWGVRLEGASPSSPAELSGAGADFVVYTLDARLATDHDKVGVILVVEPTTEDSLVRGIVGSPASALLTSVGEESKSLSWRDLLQVRRLAGLPGKPLLVSLPLSVTPGELQALGEAGVKGIVVHLRSEPDGVLLKELRKAIEGLVLRPREKTEKPMPLVPQVTVEKDNISEDEEEED